MAASAAATTPIFQQKMLYNGSAYSNPRLYFEMTGRNTVPLNGNIVQVSDSGVPVTNPDSAITGTVMPGSYLSMPSTKSRDRTSQFGAPLNNNRLMMQLTRVSGTMVINGGFLIIGIDQL